ncbi:MAG: hypothetical protein Kow0075_12040 [Salibacteraceae bacterium]
MKLLNNSLFVLSTLLLVYSCKEPKPDDFPGKTKEEVATYDETPYPFYAGRFVNPDFSDNPLTIEGV